jgi:hypothetical protein
MSSVVPRGGFGSGREDDIDLEPGKFGRDLKKALGAALRPAILDRHSAALDPAKLAQPLHEWTGP